MKTKALTIEEIELELEKQGHLVRDENGELITPRPPKPKHCQWCGGSCGSNSLRWVAHYTFHNAPIFTGWFSDQCEELSDFAFQAYDNDDS
jgi:hypothetical protein